SHSTNVVEHPELVADRIEQFASVVGRENVAASTDCGLGGRLHPQIAWAKLESLVEGARLATERLYRRAASRRPRRLRRAAGPGPPARAGPGGFHPRWSVSH